MHWIGLGFKWRSLSSVDCAFWKFSHEGPYEGRIKRNKEKNKTWNIDAIINLNFLLSAKQMIDDEKKRITIGLAWHEFRSKKNISKYEWNLKE